MEKRLTRRDRAAATRAALLEAARTVFLKAGYHGASVDAVALEAGFTIGAVYSQFGGKAEHTLGGFLVSDIDAAMADLRGKGVDFEEYDMPGLKTEKGIAELEGAKISWFKDPEGNILSLSQFPPM